jgi:hypothetical protein
MKVAVTIILVLSLATVVFTVQTAHGERVVFRAELKPYGFLNDQELTYSSLNFLSDSLVLVTINEMHTIPVRRLGKVLGTMEPLNTDSPPSTAILFDLDSHKPLLTASMHVQKYKDNVWAVRDNHFLILNSSGVQRCSTKMVCGDTYPTTGPVFVAPDRDKAFIGGNAGSQRVLLDTATLQPVNEADAQATPFPSRLKSHYNEGYNVRSVFSTNGIRADSILHDRWDHAISQEIVVYDASNAVLMRTKIRRAIYWTPALSPNGHRLALVRDGVLEVYEIPTAASADLKGRTSPGRSAPN